MAKESSGADMNHKGFPLIPINVYLEYMKKPPKECNFMCNFLGLAWVGQDGGSYRYCILKQKFVKNLKERCKPEDFQKGILKII